MARPTVRTLTRYLLRQHLAPLGFALTALTGLMLLQQIAKQFGNLVGKGLPWGVIIEVFVLSIPFIVAVTLPMAVLVAVLHAFTRLAADNEITALAASGVSTGRVAAPRRVGARPAGARRSRFVSDARGWRHPGSQPHRPHSVQPHVVPRQPHPRGGRA